MAEPHPSLLERKILHVDMDAFYAAVEIRDCPELASRPVVIGGAPDSRGVVATANYIARSFGIRSAMACSKAARLCPDAVFIRPEFEKYRRVSSQLRVILTRYSSIIEPVALDEAYLDVTHAPQGLYAVQIAVRIQQAILVELGLSCSVGVAPNKMIAKIASDMKKPGGITVVLPADVEAFMEHLPLRRINGVGPATEKRLADFGLRICGDVWVRREAELVERFGERMAQWLTMRSRGLDLRPVQTERNRKSIGCETTFVRDLRDPDSIKYEIAQITRELTRRLQKHRLQGRTLTLKVKYGDFTQVTRAVSLPKDASGIGSDDALRIHDLATVLLEKTDVGSRSVRLIGLSVANLMSSQT